MNGPHISVEIYRSCIKNFNTIILQTKGNYIANANYGTCYVCVITN